VQLLKKTPINESGYELSPNEMIEGIFSAAPIGIGIVIDRVFVFVNDFLCNLLEYPKRN